MNYAIIQIEEKHKPLVTDFITEHWGSPLCISRGKQHKVPELPGFICLHNSTILGLITYHITDRDCEIVTLNSTTENKGLGSNLIEKVLEKARSLNCRKVWLITTNDNIHAIRFYLKRGFEWSAFHKNAIETSRKLKPQIPLIGNDGIPLKHEIEFEYLL